MQLSSGALKRAERLQSRGAPAPAGPHYRTGKTIEMTWMTNIVNFLVLVQIPHKEAQKASPA